MKMRVFLNFGKGDGLMTYHTAQKARLFSFLQQHADTAFTAEELCDALAGTGAVGKSTVYRLLPQLVAEGQVKRFSGSGQRRALYQAVGCAHCDAHLHLKCTVCGRILHLDESASDAVLRRVRQSSAFSVDEGQTVLFGKCAACGKRR